MNLPRIEIVEGEVVKVQLTSETHVAGRTRARANGDLLVSSKVVNHMRLFLVGADGKERDFRFTNTTVGVREGHRVAIVRAKPAGPGPWLQVALYNRSTGLREEQIGGFAAASRQQWMQARWRAVFWSLALGLAYWPVSDALHLRSAGPGIALALAIVAYPVFWALGAITDTVLVSTQEREAEKALRQAIDARMQAPRAQGEAAMTGHEGAPVGPQSPFGPGFAAGED